MAIVVALTSLQAAMTHLSWDGKQLGMLGNPPFAGANRAKCSTATGE